MEAQLYLELETHSILYISKAIPVTGRGAL
jgi:hypothetical protein